MLFFLITAIRAVQMKRPPRDRKCQADEYKYRNGNASVEAYLQSLPPKYFSIMKIDAFNRKNTPPVLYLIKKLKENK